MTDRIIALIDMDCFYCQVETRLNPSLSGLPVAVVQYNAWKGGGIIAVNYEARDQGVTRSMRGNQAKEHCPDIVLVRVPTVRDKADLTRYRDAGREVIDVLCKFSNCVQRASIDEAYVDLTSVVEERLSQYSRSCLESLKNTFIVGYSSNLSNDEGERRKGVKAWLDDIDSIQNTASQKLALGAAVVEEIREAVFVTTGFRCSAGIAHNKILAKLTCGFHKPNKQTVLPQESVEELYKTLPIKKVRNLGGKFGDDIVENLGCKTMHDVLKFTQKELQNKYDEKTGSWLYNIARGFDFEPVTARLLSKSIGCCKQFPGRTALSSDKDVNHWLNKLAEELYDRLLEDQTMNKRKAQLLTVSMQVVVNRKHSACSKSVPLTSYNVDRIASIAFALMKKACHFNPETQNWTPPLVYLGLSAGKFTENNSNTINNFFKNSSAPDAQGLMSHSKTKVTECDNVSKNSDARASFFENVLVREKPELQELDEPSRISHVEDSTKDAKEDSSVNNVLNEQVSSDVSASPSEDKGSENDTQSLSKITNYFSKSNSMTKNGDNKIKKLKLESKNKTKKTISSFFSMPKQNKWIKPEELFPDLNEIDEDLMSFLPVSYRNRILQLKEDDKNSSNNTEFIKKDAVSTVSEPMCAETSHLISKSEVNLDHQNPFSSCASENDDVVNCDQQSKIENKCKSKKTISSFFSDSPKQNNSENSEESAPFLNENSISLKKNQGLSEKTTDITSTSQINSDSVQSGVIDYRNYIKNTMTVLCAECSEDVLAVEYEIHQDMHVALKLEKQWNSVPMKSIPLNIKEEKKFNKSKRKTKSIDSKNIPENNKKIKRIDSFFKK